MPHATEELMLYGRVACLGHEMHSFLRGHALALSWLVGAICGQLERVRLGSALRRGLRWSLRDSGHGRVGALPGRLLFQRCHIKVPG